MSDIASQALSRRLSGAGYAEIAAALGVSVDEAVAIVADRLAAGERESRATGVRLDLARLDAMLASLWPSVDLGDLNSVKASLDVMKQRAALLEQLDLPDVDEAESAAPERPGPSVADQLATLKESESEPASVLRIVGKEGDDG